MNWADLFVGSVAILSGITGIAAALFNSDASFQIAKRGGSSVGEDAGPREWSI